VSQVPDPVREGKAYQEHLIGLLGDDDPAEVQKGTADAFAFLIADAGAHLRERPEPGEWSVLECFGHVADAEIVYAGRYRWIVAHDEPPLIGYDQDLWVDNLHVNEYDPQALMERFRILRKANLEMWARSTREEREKIGQHAERGPESYDLSFRLIAGHDRFHLEQARGALASVRGY